MSKQILIAGCGDVGNALARRLLRDGDEVWGVRRRISALAPGVRPWAIDLTDPSGFHDPPAPFDVLVYTASADRRDAESYRAVYVDGLRNLVGALRDSGAPLSRVLFTSSTAVYGQREGQWVDEDADTRPTRFNGEILLEAERLVTNLDGGIVLRLSGIYGPGRTRLLRRVYEGEARSTSSWTNRIHVEDCGAALHHLMRLDSPDSIYLGTDDRPATTAEVVRWMAEQLGVDAPPESSSESLNKRCSNGRLRATGFELQFPTYRDGYAPMAAEFLRDVRPSDG